MKLCAEIRRFHPMLLPLIAVLCCAQAPVPNAGASGQYTLQAGDELEIRAFNISELDSEVRIRPDGKISLLLLNDVEAAGMSPSSLAAKLSEAYAPHFRNPRVSVNVKVFASETVFVGGEVALPAAVPLRGRLTAVQSVLQAGGIKENSFSDQVTIVHGDNRTGSKVDSLSIKDVVSGKTPDMVLGPSDVVYVQKALVNVYVGGEVTRPGLVPLHGDLTILSAVTQAGGFRPTAKTGSVVLVRDQNGTPVATKIQLDEVMMSAGMTKLQPFDVVFVPKSRIAKLDQWVDQYIRQMSPATLSFGFSYLFGQSITTSNGTTVPF